MGMALIAYNVEILEAEIIDAAHIAFDNQPGQGQGLARELFARLFEVIGIKMGIAKGVDEFAGLQAGHMRDHMGEKRVRGDVERHTDENVGGTLVELAGEPSPRDIELEEAMARRKRHALDIGRVPGRHNEPAGIRIAPQGRDDQGELIDRRAVGRGPGSPLRSIDRTQIAIGIGPFIPDADAMFLKKGGVGIAADEPQKLIDDGTDVEALGGDDRKTGSKIESHLMAENRSGSGAGAVGLGRALIQRLLHEIEILSHGPRYNDFAAEANRGTMLMPK